MVKGKDIHVISSEGRWLIMQEGNNDIIHIADSVGAAINKAREAARMNDSAIVVHNRQSH
jgi:hypothetical protein